MTSPVHQPVLLNEVIDLLAVRPRGFYVDATLGQAGHTLEIIRRGAVVLGIEANSETLAWLKQNIAQPNLTVVKGNFSTLSSIVKSQVESRVDGILFDLGLSAFELQSSGRGFSYLKDEPLDLRIDPQPGKKTAAQLLDLASEEELYEIFTKLGEVAHAHRLSQSLVRRRVIKKIATTFDLRTLVETAFPPRGSRENYRRLSQVFQALRMRVNDELHNLDKGLAGAGEILKPSGRLVVISFHSLEDRLVKRKFKQWQGVGEGFLLTKSAVRPSRVELLRNPASRSAKLRAFQKL